MFNRQLYPTHVSLMSCSLLDEVWPRALQRLLSRTPVTISALGRKNRTLGVGIQSTAGHVKKCGKFLTREVDRIYNMPETWSLIGWIERNLVSRLLVYQRSRVSLAEKILQKEVKLLWRDKLITPSALNRKWESNCAIISALS